MAERNISGPGIVLLCGGTDMATRFEIVLEQGENFFFQLRMAGGDVVLRSLGSHSKIMTQNEILHLRNSLRDKTRLVPHHTDDGGHFLVVKDADGSVLAKSCRVADEKELAALAERLRAAGDAPMIDLSKRAVHSN
jgi:uncharacterized protein YegP (UPF0339 family)